MERRLRFESPKTTPKPDGRLTYDSALKSMMSQVLLCCAEDPMSPYSQLTANVLRSSMFALKGTIASPRVPSMRGWVMSFLSETSSLRAINVVLST